MKDSVREQPVVLLVESPGSGRPSLAGHLDSAGYTVWHAESGSDARQMLAEARRARAEPDVIVLDRVLPDVDGLVLCAFLRADTPVPIILCSDSVVSSTDRALGYYVGVNGFVGSPPDPDELIALVQSVSRRVTPKQREAVDEPAPNEAWQIGSLVVHEKKRTATIDSQPLGLTPTQYRVLAILARQPDGLVSTADISHTVWNCEPDDGVASLIATQVARIRAKLRDRSATAPSIVSVPGRGYRLLAA
jgi:two-component system KDP operon response regulator KdpE